MKRSLVPVTALLFLAAAPTSAQTVYGTLTDAATGASAAGAFVVLLDAAGERVAGALTGDAGGYEIEASPGTYTLRVELVGYRGHETAPFELAAGASVERSIAMAFEPIVLEGIRVSGARRRCRAGDPGAAEATAAVWRQAQKALVATALTNEGERYRYRAARWERELEPRSLDIQAEETEVWTLYGTTPYLSLEPAEAERLGFVRDSAGMLTFYAPDVAMLLSRVFVDTHCFRVVPGPAEAPELIGLAFEPVGGRRVAEIRGTMWLHRRTAELRSLEFGYENVPWRLPSDVLGGRLDFARLPNGGWIVSSYRIRTPRLVTERLPMAGSRERTAVASIREEGGRVLDVIDPRGRPTGWLGQGSVQGTAYDSAAAAPLAGATVTLIGTAHRALSDGAGRFALAGVPPGDYLATFRHPRRVALAYDPAPVPVTVRAREVSELALGIPTGVELPTAVARSRTEGVEVTAESGRRLPELMGSWLTGQVSDAETGAPVAGMAVRAQNTEAVTDSAGRFRLHDLRPGLHEVTFSHIAYGDGAAEVRVGAWRETIVRFAVRTRPITLDEITVRVRETEQRIQMGAGVSTSIVDADELREVAARGGRIEELVRNMPGVNVREGRFYSPDHPDWLRHMVCIETMRPFATMDPGGRGRFCNMVEVYIDGLKITGPGEYLRTVSLTEFERIEYIPALGAHRWGMRATETGVLLLWTRRR